MQPVSTIHKHSYEKPTTTATGSTAPDDAEWCIHNEIQQLSGKALLDALLRSIMELDVEQQTIVLAKIRELKAKVLL